MLRSLLAAAALAALAMPTAHAASVAGTTLSDFRVTLLDLAPGDGVASSITFDPDSRSTAQGGPALVGGEQQGDSPFGAVSAGGSLGGTGGGAFFEGDAFGDGATITAVAFANSSPGSGSAAALVDTPSGVNGFVLSPRTQVTFAGMAETDWAAGDSRGIAEGEVQLQFSQLIDGNAVVLAADDFVAGRGRVRGATENGATSRPVTITFANTTDAAATLDYVLLVQSDASEGEGPVSPVDEPLGAWLLLAGALPLAWTARRRAD